MPEITEENCKKYYPPLCKFVYQENGNKKGCVCPTGMPCVSREKVSIFLSFIIKDQSFAPGEFRYNADSRYLEIPVIDEFFQKFLSEKHSELRKYVVSCTTRKDKARLHAKKNIELRKPVRFSNYAMLGEFDLPELEFFKCALILDTGYFAKVLSSYLDQPDDVLDNTFDFSDKEVQQILSSQKDIGFVIHAIDGAKPNDDPYEKLDSTVRDKPENVRMIVKSYRDFRERLKNQYNSERRGLN